MANEALMATQSFLSEGGALTQYRAVTGGTTGDQVIAVSGATDRVVGITQNNPSAAGQETTVEQVNGGGETKWEAGAAVAINALVGTDASGRCVTKSVAGDFVYGRALDAAGAAGEIIRVALTDTVLHA